MEQKLQATNTTARETVPMSMAPWSLNIPKGGSVPSGLVIFNT
jgi:hypothetical protein